MLSCLKTVCTFVLVAFCAVTSTNAFQSSSSSSFVGSQQRLATSRSSSMLQMAMPIVDNWKLLRSGEVVGMVRNHPIIEDGDVIRTSPLDDPDGVKPRTVVQTTSGSKYKLGEPSLAQQRATQQKSNGKVVSKVTSKRSPSRGVKRPVARAKNPFSFGAPKTREPASATKTKEPDNTPSLQEALRTAKSEYGLTGKSVGEDQYLLAGKPIRSTSGKSNIYTCYKNDGSGLPVGVALCAKISPNIEALRRESSNYDRVTKGLTRGQFVKFIQFYGRAGDDNKFNQQAAIILERGVKDLKSYIEENGPLEGKDLRAGAVSAIQCLQAMHSANLVWTDLKAENFVVTTETPFAMKGIDLESAMSIRDNPVDYSPEACPPEFAKAFLAGDGPYFVLDCSYDIWSLGMVFFEISVGRTMFSGRSPAQITKILKDPNFKADTSAIPDEKLRDLVNSCLQIDPKKRPSLSQILLHPFFLTTGFGPFSFL